MKELLTATDLLQIPQDAKNRNNTLEEQTRNIRHIGFKGKTNTYTKQKTKITPRNKSTGRPRELGKQMQEKGLMREGCYLTRSPLLATMTAWMEEAEALGTPSCAAVVCPRLLLEAPFVGLLRRKRQRAPQALDLGFPRAPVGNLW